MSPRSNAARTNPAAAKRRAPTRPPGRARPATDRPQRQPDGIPGWPQLKLDIVRGYGAAYSTVASRQAGLAHYYVEGFIRPGADNPVREFVPGSPLNALLVTPPFRHHYLVNMDGQPADALRRAVNDRDDVTVLDGDGDRILLEEVLPRVRHDDYRRALCVLDPRATPLDWRVVELAGRLRTIDLFVAVADPSAGSHDDVPRALKRRLREDAGFGNVLDPLPLRDGAGCVAAHLCFASRTDTANKVIDDIFARHRDGVSRGDRAPGLPARKERHA
jgi:hypothetical protein